MRNAFRLRSLPMIAFALLSFLAPNRPGFAAEPDLARLEYFEKNVRPLLIARCVKCHGPDKQKGGLRLDSRRFILEGGGNGPAVVPGKPAESLLVDAIHYGDLVQMPPKSKLPDDEIATLVKWVELGAPWPAEAETASAAKPKSSFDLAERAKHWSFQPIADPAPPSVQNESWPESPIDRFILAELERKGLKPAPDADKRTLIRRATFDLTGLPPTAAEIEAFLADDSPQAFAKVVDRLLASPRYGEREARRTLDLVRFAETYGHEFDYDIPNAFEYRDYVIRAMNSDLPFDRFVVEHVAGDLLPEPRRSPTDGVDESIVATGFFLLGEGTHSPVDVRDDEIARMDNQIDVFSKTFLGLTVSCARCHDHKFDPIRTDDYYALKGYLQSSRHQQAFIDPPERFASKIAALEAIKNRVHPGAGGEGIEVDRDRLVESRSLSRRTDSRESRSISGRPASAGEETLFEDFSGDSWNGWFATGYAFGDRPTRAGDFIVSPDPGFVPAGVAHSGIVSRKLQGVLRSQSFTIEKNYILYKVAGIKGRINVVVDSFEKIRDPIYGALALDINHGDAYSWRAQNVSMWIGHRAYIEIGDGATVDFTSGASRVLPGDGYIAVDEIRFSNQQKPNEELIRAKNGDQNAFPYREVSANSPFEKRDAASERSESNLVAANAETRADQDAREILAAFDRIRTDPRDRSAEALISRAIDRRFVRLKPISSADRDDYSRIEAEIPEPRLAQALVDGTGKDERVHIRGSYKTLGDVVPRRFLEVLAGTNQPPPRSGSGRLELALRLVDPSNPLTARVAINRIWKRHFGEGIVKSTDDFGAMGRPPTNPALLDRLATDFVRGGWSIKKMHRMIMLTHAYRMSSAIDPAAEKIDPANESLHRAAMRRLEAEEARDAILAVSGRLDLKMYGPGVPPHLTPFMEGRGRPGRSGPLDGDGRRSIYINVRRNFLTPFLLAFDYPNPFTTIGRRNISNVPAQPLTLLNDPFVVAASRDWAERLLAAEFKTDADRIGAAYLQAFGREPTDSESRSVSAFLEARRRATNDLEAWTETCHVLFNVKEFIYIP